MTTGKLEQTFLHLGLGATAVPQPPLYSSDDDPTGMKWYEDYATRTASDSGEGRLVSMHTFTEGWPTWEMHPKGAEVVICTEGTMSLTQEWPDGRREEVTLNAGEYVINPPGVWHIADIEERATAIFITAGEGTEIRPR